MFLEEIFKTKKPVIIGDIHLPPLPGSPKYDTNCKIKDFLDFALREAKIYAENGFDGIIIENFGDAPYYAERVGPEVVATMACIVSNIVKEIDIPIGIQVMRNDPIAAISIAHTCGGKFIRVESLRERSYEIQNFRKIIGAEDIKILADIKAVDLDAKSIENLAEELAYHELADGIIISTGIPGPSGKSVDAMIVERVKKKRALVNVPVLVAGGINKNNVQDYLKICDGIIVASSLRVNGISTNPLDPERVKEFMENVTK